MPTNGKLTLRQRQTDAKITAAEWSWVNEREIAVRAPVRVEWIYEFVYEAKDPKVMGIGHGATRDFVSFLKYAEKDDFGNPNPLAMTGLRARLGEEGGARSLEAVYSWGRSQGGRVQRDFVRYGFNQDESNRMVFDGMMPYATGSGGNMWMNFRFSQPPRRRIRRSIRRARADRQRTTALAALLPRARATAHIRGDKRPDHGRDQRHSAKMSRERHLPENL